MLMIKRKARRKPRFIDKIQISIPKRQRFVISVLILFWGLFFSDQLLGSYNFLFPFLLGLLADFFFFLSMYKDIKGNTSVQLFILPFVYTVSFGLFHYLIPARFLTRLIVGVLYSIGVYSLFLSQNIFIVASIRTIALLTGARIVSVVIALISYFFLANIIYTLRLPFYITAGLLFLTSFLLILHAVWMITLEKSVKSNFLWVLALSVALSEIAMSLWFWPTSPTVVALFLTGIFYTIVGLSQLWHNRRLFRGVMWEYLWVSVIVFFVLILFTSWKG